MGPTDMAPPASTFLTAGFVAFPLLLCAALVLGSDWAGRRLGESTRARVHWAIGVGAGAAAWLAVTGWLASAGRPRDWGRVPPPFAGLGVAGAALARFVSCSRLGIAR